MPLSPETEQKMKKMQEQPPSASPEDLIEPKRGWQCPVCGAVYDKEGICPVDQTLLTEIDNWSEVAAPASDETTTEEVMETGDELYPAAGDRRPAGP